ncbi:MAG: DUF3244 domain-containing protein [Bacteroidales bacterium]|nr:DUF3244 domain-containing protein [Bacteroidales bacterium]
MKTTVPLLFCLFALCITATSDPTDPPTGSEQIYLQGRLAYNAGPNDIEAYVDGNYVYVSFHRDFGAVSVTLYDPYGLSIYSDVVNTAIQQLVVIPINALNEGIYTIVLENANGYADGEFETHN